MTPKTNREKVKHIRNFKYEFPHFTLTRDQEFLLILARYTDGKELTQEAWEELDELYHHVKGLEEGDECPKKGPEYIAEPDFMETRDFVDLMQCYRIADELNQENVIRRYDNVKTFIREHFTANTEPQEPVINDSLLECDGCGRTGPGDQLSVNGLCPDCVKEFIK